MGHEQKIDRRRASVGHSPLAALHSLGIVALAGVAWAQTKTLCWSPVLHSPTRDGLVRRLDTVVLLYREPREHLQYLEVVTHIIDYWSPFC